MIFIVKNSAVQYCSNAKWRHLIFGPLCRQKLSHS